MRNLLQFLAPGEEIGTLRDGELYLSCGNLEEHTEIHVDPCGTIAVNLLTEGLKEWEFYSLADIGRIDLLTGNHHFGMIIRS